MVNEKLIRTVVFVLILLGVSTRIFAQREAPYSVTEFFGTKLISDIRVSPDGRRIAFVTSENNFDLDRTISTVWLMDVDVSGRKTGLTRLVSADNVMEPKWSADSRKVAARIFDEGKPSKLWIFGVKGHRTFLLADPRGTEAGIASFDWDPSGQNILFLSNQLGVGGRRPTTPDQIIPFGNWGETHDITVIYRLPAAYLGSKRPVQEVAKIRDYDPVELKVSPNGKTLALRLPGTIFFYDLESKNEPRRMTPSFPCLDAGMIWTERGVVFQACGVVKGEHTERTQRKIYLLHPENGKLEQLASDFAGEFWIEEILPNGNILALGNLSTRWDLYEIPIAHSRARKVTSEHGHIRQISTSHNGSLTAFSTIRPGPELYTTRDLTGPSTKVTDLNPRTRNSEPGVETVSWDNKDGDVVEGLLYHPPGQETATNLPMIVFLHGGPWIAQTEPFYYGLSPLFMNEAYYFAQRGYLVFAPNFRASTGRGDAFLRAQIGYPCSRLTVDVLTGVDHIVDKKLADPDRLGIMGSSYGGQLTNCVISRTPRFKAAAVQSGVWSLIFAQAALNGKAPWDDLKTFWDESAISRAAHIKTPTLISIGSVDEAVNPENAREESRTFNRIRVANELLIFPGEHHRFFKPSNKRIRLEAQTTWFDHFLRGMPLQ